MPEGPIERELATLRSLASRGDFTAGVLIRTFDALAKSNQGGTTARFASTANRAALSGLANTGLDGTPVEGDVILLKDQTDPKQNGLYKATAGTWPRLTDDDGNYVLGPNMMVPVREGSTLADKIYQVTSNATVVGTDDIVFAEVGGGGGGAQATGFEVLAGGTNQGNASVMDLTKGHSFLTENASARTFQIPDGTFDGQRHSFSRHRNALIEGAALTGVSRIYPTATNRFSFDGAEYTGGQTHFIEIHGDGGFMEMEWSATGGTGGFWFIKSVSPADGTASFMLS